MSSYVYDPLEKAKKNLRTKSKDEILKQISRSRGLDISTITKYYIAMSDIEFLVVSKRMKLSEDEKRIFKSNRQLLIELRNELELHDIQSAHQKYSTAFILGAIISLLREFEANIDLFPRYLEVVKFFKDLEEDCKDEEFLSSIWKDTQASIDDLFYFLQKKAHMYLPILKQIIEEIARSENPSTDKHGIILGILSENFDERETFYFLANILQTNPFLFEKLKDFCAEYHLDVEMITLQFLRSLVELKIKAKNQRVIQMVNMFLKNPKYKNKI